MKILLLYPNRKITDIESIKCFSDVWGYYLPAELSKHMKVDSMVIPARLESAQLADWFQNLPVEGYDAVISLGLRYFSFVSREIVDALRSRLFPGFLCQIHDGSRLDIDGVDITFTVKDDGQNKRYQFGSTANRHVRHRSHNEYVGWAADGVLNTTNQSPTALRFLIDHTNYGDNPVDRSDDIISQIRNFYHSGIWKDQWNELIVRRFDSGSIVTVDLEDTSPVKRYVRTGMPYQTVCEEHSQTHVFFVTHPESVGLVVLETAMAGALIVAPDGFIPPDRLATVKHYLYQDKIDWSPVLDMIDPVGCRTIALENTWERVAKRICDSISIRQTIRKCPQ